MKSILLTITIFLLVNCHSSVDESLPCGQPNGEFFQRIEGRVYKFDRKFENFEYYLGSRTDKIKGGGAIPCDFPAEFQFDGLDVVWSGFDKGYPSDVGDPHYRYVVLTVIEKAN